MLDILKFDYEISKKNSENPFMLREVETNQRRLFYLPVDIWETLG